MQKRLEEEEDGREILLPGIEIEQEEREEEAIDNMMEDHNESDESTDEYLETSSISSSEGSEASYSYFDNEADFDMWSPIQDVEDIETRSIIQFEDKDDDALILNNASYMITLEEEESVVIRFKEEKKKVLEKMLNVEFKAYVGQLLRFFDICRMEIAEAWNAASFVKPDALEDKARNLDHFVKITCVASGSPSQSELVRGLVFKKHAMHKHMQTEFSNPTLLLARGFLGQSSTGFISFDMILSPVIGKNQAVMNVAKYLKASGANVVLVEKGASRDLVDMLLGHGLSITIVSNMKLHRLERIARCTASTIMSIDYGGGHNNNNNNNNLSQHLSLRSCDRLVFHNIIEEHSHHVIREGRRRPQKTLMFIEGCATRLGCTYLIICYIYLHAHTNTHGIDQILLKGSHNEELRKIKRVVRAAVFKAYHLIRVTSFRMDLNAMFSALVGNGKSVNLGERSQLSQPLDAILTTTAPSQLGSSRKVVLMTTSLNFSRGVVCDHGRCSSTNFTLAKYILEYLLNQSWRCKTCREGCEAHIYYYTRNNKQQVGVRVQQVAHEKYYLPYSEAKEERVWFWRRCAKCKAVVAAAKRGLISEEALGLPFGRFLDLHFSNPSPFDFPSLDCAHSPHNHFLLFIGSGSMVAVFKYSAMVTKGDDEVLEAN
ncbi:hypothetical protein V2J09_024351 [Rumex salicifolius]